MNKHIVLTLLIGLGSYSCHAVFEENGIEEIIKDLHCATEQEKPGYYADALAALKENDVLDPSRKKQVLECVNREIGMPPFCVLWDKSFEEICTLVNVQMSLISAAREKNLWTYEIIVILSFVELKFLSGEELAKLIDYVQSRYWSDTSTVFDIEMGRKDLLKKLLAE